MRSRLGALLPLLGLVNIVVVAPGCKAKAVSIEVTVPSDVQEDTVWLELGAYRDSKCAAIAPMLGNGVPEGATARVAFERDKSPTFGDLDRGTYAFAAVARDVNCGVLAIGCSEVDVAKSDRISISMRATDSPTGACEKGSVCSAARCVPVSDNKNPTVGAECSLELLGAGPLAQSLGSETMLSAPAVAATPTGFVIAYREIDSAGSNPRVTVLPVDSAGGALSPGTKGLKNRCGGSDETDGVGLVMNGADGQIVVSRSRAAAKPRSSSSASAASRTSPSTARSSRRRPRRSVCSSRTRTSARATATATSSSTPRMARPTSQRFGRGRAGSSPSI